MPWYWYAIIVLSLGFVFASVCWYGAILGCGSAQATAEWERSKNEEKDAEIKRLSALVVEKHCEIEKLSEANADLERDMAKAHMEVSRQDTIIGEVKAELDTLKEESRKLRDMNGRAAGILTKGV